MTRHLDMRPGLAVALACCLLGSATAADAPAGSSTYVYNSTNRMPLEELLGRYRSQEWEIKGIFPHKSGHLGTYRVGDLVGGGFIHFSIGPIGIDGDGAYVQEKPFSRGMPVVPVLCLIEQGQVVERIPFSKGYC